MLPMIAAYGETSVTVMDITSHATAIPHDDPEAPLAAAPGGRRR